MSIKFSLYPHTQASASALQYDQGLYLPKDTGRTVLLIHGLTGSPGEMGLLARALAKAGYSVSCPRLANHGKPMDIFQKTTWQQCYDSVKDALEQILKRSEKETVFVAGLSVSALFALLLAYENPTCVRGVTCLAPTLFYDGWNMPKLRQLLPFVYRIPFLRNLFYFKDEPPYGIKDESIRARVHHYYAHAKVGDIELAAQYGYPYIPVTLLYQHFLLMKYLSPRLSSITVPVQLFHSRHDDMASIRNSELIYNQIKSSLKELIVLENSYHVITIDADREKVAEDMNIFYKRIEDQTKASLQKEQAG